MASASSSVSSASASSAVVNVHVNEQVLQEEYIQPQPTGAGVSNAKAPVLIGAIHQGTSHTRFVLFTRKGSIAASAVTEVEQVRFTPPNPLNNNNNKNETVLLDNSLPIDSCGGVDAHEGDEKEGWHEQDPLELFHTVQLVVSTLGDELKAKHGIDLNVTKLAALGITHQRETTIAWNHETGIPYYNAIVWDDTRTQVIADELAKGVGNQDRLRSRTGLPLAAYFVGTKVKWMLDNVPALQKDLADPVQQANVRFGTVDSWLIYQLTGTPCAPEYADRAINSGGQFLTDVTNASRWLFLDLQRTSEWDKSLVDDVCAPHTLPIATCLPKICPSRHMFGTCKADNGVEYLDGVPISAVMGDQQASLFGHGAFSKGDAKNTYGSALFLMMNTGTTILESPRLLTTVAYQLGPDEPVHYALEGGVSHCGSTIQWLRNQLQIIPSAPETEALATLRNDGLYFVPAFAGLFAPRWRPDARACLFGLTTSHHKGHVCRAALEAPAYQTREIFEAIVESSKNNKRENGGRIQLTTLRVDGGGTANNLMMQFQADMLNVPVVKHVVKEIACLGVAFCAGLGIGVWEDLDEVRKLWNFSKTVFLPSMSEEERHRNWSGWNKAVGKSLGWIDQPNQRGDEDIDVDYQVPQVLDTPMDRKKKFASMMMNHHNKKTIGRDRGLAEEEEEENDGIFESTVASLALCSATAFCVSVAVGALLARGGSSGRQL